MCGLLLFGSVQTLCLGAQRPTHHRIYHLPSRGTLIPAIRALLLFHPVVFQSRQEYLPGHIRVRTIPYIFGKSRAMYRRRIYPMISLQYTRTRDGDARPTQPGKSHIFLYRTSTEKTRPPGLPNAFGFGYCWLHQVSITETSSNDIGALHVYFQGQYGNLHGMYIYLYCTYINVSRNT